MFSSVPSRIAWTELDPRIGKALREIVGNNERHGAIAAIDGVLDRVVGWQNVCDLEIDRGLEPLQKRLAQLRAFAIEDADRQVLHVEAQAIAQKRHLQERHEKRHHQAARIADDLQHFLARDGADAIELHAAAACRLRLTRRTNTSSREGAIGAIRLMPTPFLWSAVTSSSGCKALSSST